MAPEIKLYKIVIEDILLKITINYQNGLLMMKKNIILRRTQSQNNNFHNRSKDLWQSMQEYLKRSCKLKSERKFECKKNLKKFKRKLRL